jgi:hypothetical protein
MALPSLLNFGLNKLTKIGISRFCQRVGDDVTLHEMISFAFSNKSEIIPKFENYWSRKDHLLCVHIG